MTAEDIKKVKIWITSFAGIIASIYGLYEGYSAISKNIDKVVKDKILHYSKPLVNQRIKQTVDSIMSSNKSNIIKIGLFHDGKKLWYRHTNLEVYRPIYDDLDQRYYFINNNSIAEWCK